MKTINFLYFAYNFSQEHLEHIFELLGNYDHFSSKFRSMYGEGGTHKFFNFMMELTDDNKQIIIDYIDKNYKGC